jgi:Eukaryotic aspartyl protease
LPVQSDAHAGGVTSFTVALDNFNVIGAENKNQYSKSNLSMPVILDSGTTLTYLPDDIANDLYTGVGATSSASYGIVVPCDLMTSPATFNFGFGNANGPVIVASIAQFVLPFPADVPTPHFRTSGKAACRWGIQAAGARPNLFGDTFLRAAYVVYNLENNEIGIANTIFNTTKSNIMEISAPKQIPGATSTAAGVVAKQTATGLYSASAGLGSLRTGAAQPFSTATATFNLGATKPASTSSSVGSHSKKGSSPHHQPLSTARTFACVAVVSCMMALLGGSLLAFV